MSDVLIGKNTITNQEVFLTFPTVAVITGKKGAGKTFLLYKVIERKTDGRIILFTNKPDHYQGLGGKNLRVQEGELEFDIDSHLTIVDVSYLYHDDPTVVLDDAIRNFNKKTVENDLIILDEAFPTYAEEEYKQELYRSIEDGWKAGVSIIVSTNDTENLINTVPDLLSMCEYSICMIQDKDLAVKFCELSASDRGRYELLQYYDAMEFGSAIISRQDGSVDFTKVG